MSLSIPLSNSQMGTDLNAAFGVFLYYLLPFNYTCVLCRYFQSLQKIVHHYYSIVIIAALYSHNHTEPTQ